MKAFRLCYFGAAFLAALFLLASFLPLQLF